MLERSMLVVSSTLSDVANRSAPSTVNVTPIGPKGMANPGMTVMLTRSMASSSV